MSIYMYKLSWEDEINTRLWWGVFRSQWLTFWPEEKAQRYKGTAYPFKDPDFILFSVGFVLKEQSRMDNLRYRQQWAQDTDRRQIKQENLHRKLKRWAPLHSPHARMAESGVKHHAPFSFDSCIVCPLIYVSFFTPMLSSNFSELNVQR